MKRVSTRPMVRMALSLVALASSFMRGSTRRLSGLRECRHGGGVKASEMFFTAMFVRVRFAPAETGVELSSFASVVCTTGVHFYNFTAASYARLQHALD